MLQNAVALRPLRKTLELPEGAEKKPSGRGSRPDWAVTRRAVTEALRCIWILVKKELGIESELFVHTDLEGRNKIVPENAALLLLYRGPGVVGPRDVKEVPFAREYSALLALYRGDKLWNNELHKRRHRLQERLRTALVDPVMNVLKKTAEQLCGVEKVKESRKKTSAVVGSCSSSSK